MRGDFEILAYNILQWSGGKLPWEENKLLDAPAKVQQAKENLMSNLDSQLKDCFAAKRCPGNYSNGCFDFCISFTEWIFNGFRSNQRLFQVRNQA